MNKLVFGTGKIFLPCAIYQSSLLKIYEVKKKMKCCKYRPRGFGRSHIWRGTNLIISPSPRKYRQGTRFLKWQMWLGNVKCGIHTTSHNEYLSLGALLLMWSCHFKVNLVTLKPPVLRMIVRKRECEGERRGRGDRKREREREREVLFIHLSILSPRLRQNNLEYFPSEAP